MTKYVDKYPDPGPRPEEPPPEGEFTSDAYFKAWREKTERMDRWQLQRRQHEIAQAIDFYVARAAGTAWPDQGAPVPLVGIERAHMVMWLSYLREPLPPEIFS